MRMIQDICLLEFPSGVGIVYGLLDVAEPLQIRYVGQTKVHPQARLSQHVTHYSHGRSASLNRWIKEVRYRGSNVVMRVLGEYPFQVLNHAEVRWIHFFAQYCDLLNVDLLRRRIPREVAT